MKTDFLVKRLCALAKAPYYLQRACVKGRNLVRVWRRSPKKSVCLIEPTPKWVGKNAEPLAYDDEEVVGLDGIKFVVPGALLLKCMTSMTLSRSRTPDFLEASHPGEHWEFESETGTYRRTR